jgi:soluble lytic murein transglycosylase-like protein
LNVRSGLAYNLAMKAALALAAGACVGPAAQAAERISLTNGFDVVCDHHALVEGRVRIYPRAAAPDYFELNPEAVSAVEMLPDAPVETTEHDAAPETAKQEARPAESADTRLTVAELHQLLSKAGSEHNVDEDLLASVVKAESNGNARAVSRAGARGLMQLMPGTAQQLGVADSFAPEENVRGGSAYLDALLTRYHDNIVLALAAYNAGPEAVDRYRRIPPYHETQVYVARVIHEFNRRVAAREKAARQWTTMQGLGSGPGRSGGPGGPNGSQRQN